MICKKDGCDAPAIGVHRKLPAGYCRKDLIAAVRPQLRRYEVTGDLAIVGLDGEPVRKPGIVELHPEATNIRALISARLVREAPKPKPAAAADKPKPASS